MPSQECSSDHDAAYVPETKRIQQGVMPKTFPRLGGSIKNNIVNDPIATNTAFIVTNIASDLGLQLMDPAVEGNRNNRQDQRLTM